MIITRVTIFKNKLIKLFSDESLTKKATLNAVASGLDYVSILIVGFVITPMMVAGLGNYLYGVWQIMNRILSYMSITAGSASPLEWTLAKEQSIENYDLKRRYVGSALVIWFLFLPFIASVGGIVAWFIPSWLKVPLEYLWQVRVVAWVLVASLATTSLSFMPYAILRGQNQGYRRLGFSVIVYFINGGLTWLVLYLKGGIIGVAISYLVQGFITGTFYVLLCRAHIPWFGFRFPSYGLVKNFYKLSWWYLASDIVANITYSIDVVVLGMLGLVVSVTPYTLTKFIPETLISIVNFIVVSIIPGLGGIIGAGDTKKASHVRGEMMTLTWLLIVTVETTVLLWNRIFLQLWIGKDQYAGTLANLLIVIVVLQFIFIRTDASIIDLSLRLQRKVLFGIISVTITILVSSILIKVFNLNIIGISLGLIIGRSILSIMYPRIVNRNLQIQFSSQLKSIIRPAAVTILLFGSASVLDFLAHPIMFHGIQGWLMLLLGVGITLVCVTFIAFFGGLSRDQRRRIMSRFHIITVT